MHLSFLDAYCVACNFLQLPVFVDFTMYVMIISYPLACASIRKTSACFATHFEVKAAI